MAEIGEVMSVEILRPGNADLIAANGWPCSHAGCDAKVAVEVRFTRRTRGAPGYSVGCHGTCGAHAEDHARALKHDYSVAEG